MATLSSPWGRLIGLGDLWEKNNAPLVGYYATKGGLILVVHMGQLVYQPRWATNISYGNLRGVLR